MIKKSLLAASALLFVTSAPATAAPILLDFEFDGVSGTFYGLDDAIFTSQAATSFDFDGVFDTYIGVSAPFNVNAFVFDSAGTISTINFWFDGTTVGPVAGVAGIGELSRLDFLFGNFAVANEASGGSTSSVQTPIADATFTTRAVPLVPLPAGGLLLLSGLAGVAGLKRWKNRAA